MSKNRELSESETEATKRLKKIWNEKKKDLKLSQEKLALECGWSGQSAFSQYYHGRVPLNTEAVLKLAKVLKVHPTEIMPEIAEFLPTNPITAKIDKVQETPYGLTPEAIEFAKAWQELPPEQRSALKAFVYATQKPNKKIA